MSRSNPTTQNQNPATRFFEWDGSSGEVRYYDKNAPSDKQGAKPDEKGANVSCGSKFSFIVLDELATVKGWHDASDSGIFANEVRDTKAERFLVKSFKGGILAEGFYSSIRDRIIAQGAHFTANVYIAYKDENKKLQLGAIQFKGAALNSWVEFRKKARAEIYSQAIQINGYAEGKKGKITFRTPLFFINKLSPETNAEALAIDVELQKYLKAYLAKPHADKVDNAAQPHAPAENNGAGAGDGSPISEPEPPVQPQSNDLDIPF